MLHILSDDADEGSFEIPLSATVYSHSPLLPELDVQQPAGKSLKDGSSVRSFGSVKVKSDETKVFVIKNLGKANLTVASVKKNGPQAKDFIVTPPVGTIVKPGAIMKFKVTFKPSAKGLRKAAIHIKCNDADETSFDIELAGKGVTGTSTSPALAGSSSFISSSLIPAPKVTTTRETIHGLSYLTLTVITPPGTTFERPIVEVSPNLVDWYCGPIHTTVVTDNAVKFVVRDNIAVGPGARRHIRIKSSPASRDPRRAVRRP